MLDGRSRGHGDTFVYDVVAEAAHPDNGRPFLQLRIHKGNTGLGVALQMTADQGTVHAWNHTHCPTTWATGDKTSKPPHPAGCKARQPTASNNRRVAKV